MKKGWIISIVICIFIGVIFSGIYFNSHAWGTWGDDSAGYIYLWGRMSQDKPLVYQEDLTVKALEFFDDEKLARWTTPTHHEIISPAGYIASKYPIGLSLIMYCFSKLSGNDDAIYFVLPLLAMLNLILVFLISNIIFNKIKYKYFYSLLAVATLGLAELYYNYAVAQPMREIPSLFFILLAYYLLLLAIESRISPDRSCCITAGGRRSTKYIFYMLFVLGVLALGYSFNIRETAIVVMPAFFIMLFKFWDKNKTQIENVKKIAILSGLAIIVLIIAIIPSITNSVDISKHKEKFKKKDISAIAITSNLDHISSLGLGNVFNNQGKFKPGQGSLPYYWIIMQQMSVWPVFIILVIIGLISLYRKDRLLASSLFLWFLGVLTIYSLWVNPYSRYILLLFPVLAILGSYGFYSLLVNIVPYFFKHKKIQLVVGSIIIISLVVSYQPLIADVINKLEPETEQELIFKAISQQDLSNLKNLSNIIKEQSTNKKPLVIFTGTWQYGISETFESHTGIQSIRMPLSQKKFVFDEFQVKEFFDKYLIEDYNVFVWTDTTTKPDSRELIKQYNMKNTANYIFSFEEQVNIYELTQKN